MVEENIIECPHCGGQNRKPPESVKGIRACGHCKQPLNEAPLKMGELNRPSYRSPFLINTQDSPKTKLLKLLIYACLFLFLISIIKSF